jgi:lipopolysaccharide export system protein LptA
MQTRLVLLVLALAACPTGAGALSTDRDQPVRIDAGSASLDHQNRIATYRDNVVIVRGSLRITGDLVTMRFDEGYDLATLVAEGEPAHFEQQLDSGPMQKGEAARIEYRVEDGAMIFAGSAQIAQGEFRMRAERIDYDSVTGSIQGVADESESEGPRVTITLKGEKK